MARLNVTASRPLTHEGASAFNISPEKMLRRSVLSCFLWEKEFYEDGQEISARITETAAKVSPGVLASLAIEARHEHHLRHVPLLLLDVLSVTGKGDPIVADTVANVVNRADEMGELISIVFRDRAPRERKTLPAQIRKGLARAFRKFDEYQLAKYDRAKAGFKLRDVARIVHPRPIGKSQADLWKRVINGTLKTPDTWEVALSAGADKRETFERLIKEGRLGYLALLRNLRNMAQAGVDDGLVRDAIVARKGAHNILPFRYVAAAKAAPQFEPALDQAMCEVIEELPRLSGKTIILVDVSGSMDWNLSGRSDMARIDAAAALGSIITGDVRVFTFSNHLVEVAPRRGMAGVDVIKNSQRHSGTELGGAVRHVNTLPHDRLIVITDEQSCSSVPDPIAKRGYMINVASARNGVGYGKWVHIDGFSESVLKFIHAREIGAD